MASINREIYTPKTLITNSMFMVNELKHSIPVKPLLKKINKNILSTSHLHTPGLTPIDKVLADYVQPGWTPYDCVITAHLLIKSNDNYDWDYLGLVNCKSMTRSLVFHLNKLVKECAELINTNNYYKYANLDVKLVFDHHIIDWWIRENTIASLPLWNGVHDLWLNNPTELQCAVNDLGYSLGALYQWTWTNNAQIAVLLAAEQKMELNKLHRSTTQLPDHIHSLITPEVIMEQIKKSNKAEDWKCCVCLQEFDDQDVKPKLTKCGHVLCETCMPRCSECPMCRAKL